MRKLYLLLFVFVALNGFSQSNYTILGSAQQLSGCNCFQLTCDCQNEAGAFFQNHTINLNNSFDFTFAIYLGSNGNFGSSGYGHSADGEVFVLTTNPNGLGAGGGGLGYGNPSTQPCSFAIEFDTWDNSGWDPDDHHTAYESGGQVTHNLAGPIDGSGNGGTMADGNWHTIRVVWDVTTSTMTEYYDGNMRISQVIPNLVSSILCGNPIVNWGWTAGTGGGHNTQQVCTKNISSWTAGTDYESCTPTIQFTDVSTANAGSIASWAWDFGDNTTSNLQSPSHTYSGNGTFNVTLTITDVNGCVNTFTHSVIIAPPITLSPVALNDPPCNGGTNGSIDTHPSGGFGPAAGFGGYNYTWNNTPLTNDSSFVGHGAGTYTVSVTDGVCTTTAQYTLNQPPPLTATVSHTDAPCGGTGSATIVISGGVPPYTYSWNTTFNGLSVGNLPPATYVANPTDANGCSSLLQYRVTIASLPCGYTLATSNTNVSCFGGSNGSVTLTVTGSVGAVTITWVNAANNSPVGSGATVNGLPAGTYNYNYQDNNQNFTGSVIVSQPGSAMGIHMVTTDVSCGGNANGQAVVSVDSGGVSPFTYTWNPAQPNNPVASNLGQGPISVVVTDANGCTATTSGNISAPPILQVTFATTNNACSSYNNGSATANPTGGTSPYTYNWSNISSAQTDLSLGAGTYIVTVTDSRNCTVTGSTSITTAAPLVHSAVQTNVLCKGDATGSITLNTSGGNGPYTYAWSSDSLGNVNASLTGPSISSLLAGVYLVTATDGNGCTYRDSFNILEPLLAFTATSAHTDVTCFGANDGTVTITANGGTGAYTYTWNPNVSTTNSATGLSANTYLVTAADANSCSASFSETVTAPGPQSLALADSSNTCFGQSNGYAAATFVNATGTVNYVWSNTQQTQIINNLAAGTYIVTATDANSCVLVDSVTITQPAALTMPVAVTDATCFGANGSVTANPVGGVQPFTYAWSGTSATTQTVALPFGSYTVTASDATQCGQTAAFSIAQPTAIDVQVAQTNILCNGAATGSITLTVSGGTGTYTYTWAPNVSSTNTATGLTAGPYNIQVMDAANCTVDTIVTLTQPAALTATALPTAVLCFGQSNGSIDITASGGTSPYSYTITDGTNPLTNTTGQFSGLAANTYAITVTDQNQCTYSTSATVTQPLQFTDVIARVNPTCYKYTNGQVVVVATGGTPTYNYSFSNGTVNTTGTLNNLAAGTYTVTVSDLNNCTISDSTTLTQPDSVIINVTPTPVEVKLGVPLQLNTTTNQAGNVTYNWSPDFGLSCYNCPDPVFNGVYSQTYKVTTTTQDGCVGSTEFVVTVIPNYDIFIPNVFTPNNDGNNDFWQMFGNLTAVKQVDVAVYNRIGEKVFESNDINFKWDGTYKGTPAPEGVYVYTGKFVWLNNHSDNGFKGTITLLR